MRRGAWVISVVALMAAVVGVVLLGRGSDDETFRVAAVFDTAKGMVAGQQVKIAGAAVGRVDEVDLTAQRKARLVLNIDRRFAPFRADASCRILPEGLISENFVECDPGGAAGRLRDDASGVPTVPLAQTVVPVSLQDVLDTFPVSASRRVGMVISELGIATAGHGDDLNSLLRRANPALAQSRRALQIVNRQRSDVRAAIDQTNRVLATLGRRDNDVRRFVTQTASLTSTTARHRAPLGESIRRLPAMLSAARPALRSLDAGISDATPLLARVRDAAPAADQVVRDLPPFADTGVAALRSIATIAPRGQATLRKARPLARRLQEAAGPIEDTAKTLAPFLVDSRDKGAFEWILRTAYSFATNFAMYDPVSHLLTFNLGVQGQCLAAEAAGQRLPECTHRYDDPGHGTIPVNAPKCGPQVNFWTGYCGSGFRSLGRRAPTTPHAPPQRKERPQKVQHEPSSKPTPPRDAGAVKPQAPKLPTVGGTVDDVKQGIKELLDFLLKP